jgi:DNA/RNA endonuclease G (NUC1)
MKLYTKLINRTLALDGWFEKRFYIFTLLMFRKTNKTTINKNKTKIPIRPFDSRLYLDKSRLWKHVGFLGM